MEQKHVCLQRRVRLIIVGMSDGKEHVLRIPEDSDIKKYFDDSFDEKGCDLMFRGEIIKDGDSPKRLKMKNGEHILVLSEIDSISIFSPFHAHKTNVPRNVMILASDESLGDVEYTWEDLDLGIEVSELKLKLLTYLKQRCIYKDIWKNLVLVHNETLLDDHDTLEGAGVTPGDVIGVVNLQRFAQGTKEQKGVQTSIVIHTATKCQSVTKSLKNLGGSSKLIFQDLSRMGLTYKTYQTVLYVGPKRHSKQKKNFPIVTLEGFNDQTRVSDLLYSYNRFSKLPARKELRFNNKTLKPDELVIDVLKCGFVDKDCFLFEFNYFTFVDSEVKDNWNNDARSIDELIRDIEGKKEEKKISKKKRNKKQRKQENFKPTFHGDSRNLGDDSEILGKIEVELDLEDGDKVEVSSNRMDCKEKKRQTLAKDKSRLESELKNKQKLLQENRLSLEEKSSDVKNLLVELEEAENDNILHQKKIDQMDLEIADLEAKLGSIKKDKVVVKNKVELNNERIQNLTEKKLRLDEHIDMEIQRTTEKAKTIETEISEMEEEIVQNLKQTLELYDSKEKSSIAPDSSQKLLNFLIEKKEKELECPVCLVTATVPIYSCPESHLICSTCRPKVTDCPECRLEYRDNDQPRRHRYAERMVEELDMLRRERI